jgi:hypothetical protein
VLRHGEASSYDLEEGLYWIRVIGPHDAVGDVTVLVRPSDN